MNAKRLEVGDLVRRDAEDVWPIVSIPSDYDGYADRAECICERQSFGWLQNDGSRCEPWAKNGRIEHFVIGDLKWLDAGTLD